MRPSVPPAMTILNFQPSPYSGSVFLRPHRERRSSRSRPAPVRCRRAPMRTPRCSASSRPRTALSSVESRSGRIRVKTRVRAERAHGQRRADRAVDAAGDGDDQPALVQHPCGDFAQARADPRWLPARSRGRGRSSPAGSSNLPRSGRCQFDRWILPDALLGRHERTRSASESCRRRADRGNAP